MFVALVDAPQEALHAGIFGGHWYRFSETAAHAVVYWKGGPKSPDHDLILFHVEATIVRAGAGTLLVRQLVAWADERGLQLSCSCPAERVAWMERCGFVQVGRHRGETVMAVPPRVGAPTDPRVVVET